MTALQDNLKVQAAEPETQVAEPQEVNTEVSQDTAPQEQPADATVANHPTPVKPYKNMCAILGFVLGIIGWLLLMVNEWVTLSAGIIALALSIVGCRRRQRSNMRNLAITGIIIAGVLVLDIILILVGIEWLKSM
ncbi:MAG: DUF4190 domain-containing protein [Muribaculaceae bacterium]|nr:DUF4190 domain-containing protein [Muribaculaceae bacterium]